MTQLPVLHPHGQSSGVDHACSKTVPLNAAAQKSKGSPIRLLRAPGPVD